MKRWVLRDFWKTSSDLDVLTDAGSAFQILRAYTEKALSPKDLECARGTERVRVEAAFCHHRDSLDELSRPIIFKIQSFLQQLVIEMLAIGSNFFQIFITILLAGKDEIPLLTPSCSL